MLTDPKLRSQADALPGTRFPEPLLDSFGADAVERWFTDKEVEEVVEFTKRLSI